MVSCVMLLTFAGSARSLLLKEEILARGRSELLLEQGTLVTDVLLKQWTSVR